MKTLISKTAIDPYLTRVRNSMRREDRETIPDSYRTVFRQAVDQMGLSIRRRPNRHTNRSQAAITGHFTLRYHKNDVRSQNILVAEHEAR